MIQQLKDLALSLEEQAKKVKNEANEFFAVDQHSARGFAKNGEAIGLMTASAEVWKTINSIQLSN